MQNPFYITLPYDDLNDSIAFANRCTNVPWANDPGYAGHCTDQAFSYMKNRWVAITGPNGSTCYGQIEDAGPSSGSLYHDSVYVFGATNARPVNKMFSGDPTQGAGMDVSPALNGCLGYADLDGDNDHVSWHFVDAIDVPAGPWTEIVTTSPVVLEVGTAPAAPTGVNATAGNATATLTWTAPPNGGSPITSYTITPHTGATNLTPTTITGTPPATSTSIPGLTNGTAYSGTRSARLGLNTGTEPLGDSTLAQTINVPATGTSTLTFWYQPHSADTGCSGASCSRDWMEGQIRSTTGTTLASLFKLNSNTGAWTQVTANLAAYKGQTITLWFNVHLNGPNPTDDTWMYLDDVALTTG
ncbi:fibronectin type III domain-containing protein [Pseudarthrobacter sp. P1]|uniref:fibronectin type III domain-containing protein n=1 Tax=Pseudarthrobacter sp. P1 TaxID=3418418 RepID=UPI003CF09936